ncbi:RICIN domain-containing protein [Endozoicomonas sp. SCSIO W0465]|uniref:RICIN domain-containing protein n=1 Tax=Endozoicomonas sp. SCSIO W0465 TaxID=2918516 RepID=UPI0021117AE3|nr:RICIN domain-containing protein [Endozoicomonas sp. SCSIO W0465]
MFEPEAHVKLRSLYADNLCLTNQNGRIIGKACVPNNRHQTWGLDAKERYKSRSGNNQCLGIDDNNGLYVDTCNENLSQKWYWEDEKLVSRKIDDHGHNLVLQWHGEESDQIEVISEPLSDGLDSSWRNELSVLM